MPDSMRAESENGLEQNEELRKFTAIEANE